MIRMAQPPSIGKKHHQASLQRFTIYSSMFATSETLLTSFMLWGFGGKSKSGKGPPTLKKRPKKYRQFDAHTKKTPITRPIQAKMVKTLSLECWYNKDMSFMNFYFHGLKWLSEKKFGGPSFAQKEVNFRYSQKFSFQKKLKKHPEGFFFKRGPLHFAVIRYGAFGQTIPCQG